LSKKEWYKYFRESADYQFEDENKFIWNRYSFLRAVFKPIIQKSYLSLLDKNVFFKLLEKPSFFLTVEEELSPFSFT
jgi:hypothetical protein